MVSKAFRLLTVVAVLALTLSYASPAQAGPKSCDNRTNDTSEKLRECLTLDGVREHQAALQKIADENGGTRAAGFPGYEDSVDYVVERMEAAGYIVTRHEFPFVFVPPPTLQQLTPVSATYETGAFTGTGYGEVTGNVIPVDINLAPPRATTSGCEAADFAGLDFSGPADIALIQRGTCNFSVKAINAEAAGAEAVIIFNQGSDSTRLDLIVGTLGGTNVVAVPVVGASFANGEALAQAGSTAYVKVDAPQNITVNNVLAESLTGDPNNVVMAGAHLDSVQRGPGINDNGSGSAALLEIAEQMAKVKPLNKVRFAWWGAEEAGLVGSTAYVNGLSQAERDKIVLYLNFDMIGSPNFVRFVYDGDNSAFPPAPGSVQAGPPGSGAIEQLFVDYFNSQGLANEPTPFSGRSDYGPFITIAGIPAGGLFTGAEGIKTAAQAATYGGTAGQQYDPCYHLACDTYANNSNIALDQMSDAVAHAVIVYAMRDFGLDPLLDPAPANTTGTSGGGGGLHDHHEELE